MHASTRPVRTVPEPSDEVRPAPTSDVMLRLRTDTAEAHAGVETTLDLLAADLTAERLTAVAARMWGFHAGLEPQVDTAAAAGAPAWLDWPRRRKLDGMTADLHALGLSTEAVAGVPRMPAAPVRDTADLLGRLYVVEGATLGGQFISRHLEALDLPALALFAPYGEHTGRLWHEFRTGTRAWTDGDNARIDAVVAAAQDTFTALQEWCAPLAVAR